MQHHLEYIIHQNQRSESWKYWMMLSVLLAECVFHLDLISTIYISLSRSLSTQRTSIMSSKIGKYKWFIWPMMITFQVQWTIHAHQKKEGKLNFPSALMLTQGNQNFKEVLCLFVFSLNSIPTQCYKQPLPLEVLLVAI